MGYIFRKAAQEDIDIIWDILQQAIIRRKEDGSDQWQDGYPNPLVIEKDIVASNGYVLVDDDTIVGYCAVLVNDEPAYGNIKGKWITTEDFLVLHRVAISEKHLGKGYAKIMLSFIEKIASNQHIKSIKADTNHDNIGMLKVFEKLGYVYCGEVILRGNSRKAFEKVLAD